MSDNTTEQKYYNELRLINHIRFLKMPPPVPKPKKVLIIDDEKTVIDLLSMMLSKKGYMIYSAIDGAQAIQQAFQIKPDLIILDMMMPAGSGSSVYGRLKQSILTQRIPVIFLTAMTLDKVKELIPDIDEQRVFPKPWTSTELLPVIDAILGN